MLSKGEHDKKNILSLSPALVAVMGPWVETIHAVIKLDAMLLRGEEALTEACQLGPSREQSCCRGEYITIPECKDVRHDC